MLRESTTAILERNAVWRGAAATEPYEAGWAREAVIFVRALKPATGEMPMARVEISPDGQNWLAEGTTLRLPSGQDEVAAARVRHFGNWLRLAADMPDGSALTVLVTLHLK